MDFAAIRNAAEAYKPAMVKFLRDMIAIPSESCEEEGVVKRIAEELCVSLNSVQTYAKSLYRKLGVHSRQEVIDLASRTGQDERDI